MIRVLGLAGGIAGAVALSQFPEFSQQYLQRLGGQADVLNQIEADFDAAAGEAGLTRAAALADLSGSTFRDEHGRDMAATLARAEHVRADLALLRAATPLERIALPHRFRDPQTLAATWADFQPGLPVSLDGVIAAGIGFVLGLALIRGLMALVAMPFRRLA